MEWMILPLKRYAQFSGRSQRKEYWMFALFNILVQIVLNIVDSLLGLGGHAHSYSATGNGAFAAGAGSSGGLLSGIWSLAVLLPSLTVAVRRLHDVDRSGWWLLAPAVGVFFGILIMLGGAAGGALGSVRYVGLLGLLVAGIMGIVLLVWACTDGTRGPNRFGPDPKADLGDLHETFR